MSVKKGDRKESKVKFDNNYFSIHDDCVRLIENHLGAKGEIKESHKYYIRSVSNAIYKSVCEMGTYIRIANSIYPKYQSELEERRIAQEKAIGLCFDLLTEGVMPEYDIRNNYKSWRNNITKDHNVYQDTIDSMDKLYNELFPVREVYHRQTREELIKQTFYENKEELKCLRKTSLSY